MKATSSGRIIGYALEDYNENKKPIELEGTKTEQFKARFSRDLGKKKLREKAKDILKESKIENKKSANLISGNAVNEAGLETDLSNILEPASNTTTTAETSTEQATSVIVENISNAEIVNASGGNENTSQTNAALNYQTEAQTNNENKNINPIDEINNLEDLKNIYRKSMGKNLEDNEDDFKKAMEAVKEKERLDEDAKAVEANAVPKILAILSPGLNHAEAQQIVQAPQQIAQLDYMSKVNGSIILRLG